MRSLLRRFGFWLAWAAVVLLLAGLALFPVRSTLIRLGLIGLASLVWLGLIALVWRRPILRLAALSLSALGILASFLPGRVLAENELREACTWHLQRYDRTRYVYGGENARGIDCSGLVRAAMIEALTDQAFRHLNPHALRAALWLWWHDSNAIDLGKGARGATHPISGDGYRTLAEAPPDLRPGDLAVTESGSHVLAYLGSQRWIEAEPNVGGTHVFDLSGRFAYLADERVRFMRWQWLAGPPPEKTR